MKLLFLGTSSGWPLPRLGCQCNLCLSKDPRDKRLRPSLLINERVLIDAPPDIYHQLFLHRIDPTKISDIIITHSHDDHIMGLYDLSHIYNNSHKISLITTIGVFSQISKKMYISLRRFKWLKAQPMQKISLTKDPFCSFLPVNHGTTEAYAIKIKDGKPIVYAPEFKTIPKSSKKYLGDIELAIIDGSSKDFLGNAKGHQTIKEGIRLGYELHAKKVIFTNIGHKTDTFINLNSFVNKESSKFSIAYDGLSFDV
jgi:phosphoribosyl 1,2-cyclic phosphate phosphodiesterase